MSVASKLRDIVGGAQELIADHVKAAGYARLTPSQTATVTSIIKLNKQLLETIELAAQNAEADDRRILELEAQLRSYKRTYG
jgi:hypothetical protein